METAVKIYCYGHIWGTGALLNRGMLTNTVFVPRAPFPVSSSLYFRNQTHCLIILALDQDVQRFLFEDTLQREI